MALSPDLIQVAAQSVGTPFYAYDASALRSRVAALKSAIPDAAFVYSLKANPNLSIVQCLTREGIGAEICSLFELETCLAADVPAKDVIFVGPAKSRAEIGRAISVGLKAIVVESIEEIATIDAIASELGRIQPIALRINPSFHTPGAKLSMSGKPTQFGIDQDLIPDALRQAAACTNCRLVGLHVYMGTRILDYRVVVQNTANVLALATDIILDAGHALEFVDIGGGFGVPYTDSEGALDLVSLGREVTALLTPWKAMHPHTQIVIELGRYMVAEAGVFVTAVRSVKCSKGEYFAVCDGGSNVHSAAAQSARFNRNFPMTAVHRRDGDAAPWNVSGPLCTPTDVIGKGVDLGPLQPGDLIQIDNSGAYGVTASPADFLSFARPAEVIIDAGAITLIRQPGTLKHHLQQQAPRPITHVQPAVRAMALEEV